MQREVIFMIHYTATLLLGAGILIAGFRLMTAGRNRSPQWNIWATMYVAFFFLGYAVMEFWILYFLCIVGLEVGETTVYFDGVLDPRIPLGTRFAIVAQTLGPPIWFVIVTIGNGRSEPRWVEK